jgi:hypothetical protein
MKPSDYDQPIIPSMDKLSQQFQFSDPSLPLADENGKVSLCKHLLSVKLGRWLNPGEMVRFLDGNPKNINLSNLDVALKDVVPSKSQNLQIELVCPCCGQFLSLTITRRNQRLTRLNHYHQLELYKFKIDPEELRQLVWDMPSHDIAHLYGVSERTIGRRLREFGIKKPPLGYWQIVRAKQRKNPLTISKDPDMR